MRQRSSGDGGAYPHAGTSSGRSFRPPFFHVQLCIKTVGCQVRCSKQPYANRTSWLSIFSPSNSNQAMKFRPASTWGASGGRPPTFRRRGCCRNRTISVSPRRFRWARRRNGGRGKRCSGGCSHSVNWKWSSPRSSSWEGGDADFLLGFADRRFEGGLAGLELAAGAVDLARTETALLADEQHAAVCDDETEVGPLARLPVFPIHGERVGGGGGFSILDSRFLIFDWRFRALIGGMSSSLALRVAALAGFLAVALGAFGAHALKTTLAANGNLPIWQTAAQYHLVHAVVLLVLATRSAVARLPFALFGNWDRDLQREPLRTGGDQREWLGAITPIGGLCLLAGWLALAFGRPSAAT